MNPEFYDYIMDKLLAAGALDVYLSNIQMKKNRPAVKLSVLVKEGLLEEIIDIILKETTSLGVRILDNVERYCLQREFKEVDTPWGKVKVKIACRGDEVINIAPEYEDCRKIAVKEGVSLKEVYCRAKRCVELSNY